VYHRTILKEESSASDLRFTPFQVLSRLPQETLLYTRGKKSGPVEGANLPHRLDLPMLN